MNRSTWGEPLTPAEEEALARYFERARWACSAERKAARAEGVRLLRAVEARSRGGGTGGVSYVLLVVGFDDPREGVEVWYRYTSPYISGDGALRHPSESRWNRDRFDKDKILAAELRPDRGVPFGTNTWIYPVPNEEALFASLRDHIRNEAAR